MNDRVDLCAYDEAVARTQTLYRKRHNEQRAGTLARLRRRKFTWRKLALYLIALALLWGAEPATANFIAGSVIVALGLVLRLWCFGHLEKNQALVTTGPFAHTRNPAYLGSALIALGCLLAAGNPDTWRGIAVWAIGAAGFALFFGAYLPRKYRKEYARLARLFPREFERHARHVPHFMPRLRPWRSGSERRFSWALVWLNHEPVWTLVCVTALAVMWFG